MTNKHFEFEEDFHDKDRKKYRKERKILTEKDRSKFKKTDQKKLRPAAPSNENLLRGRVLAIMADGILVDHEGKLYTCALRGTLKKDKARIKNLIAVGDFVRFIPYEDLTGSIAHVDERHSILSRAEQISREKEQLIAVNIDQVCITMSVAAPALKPPLIDRYIIAALKGNMDPIIVINKIDLLDSASEVYEKLLFEEIYKTYTELGIPIVAVSTLTGKGLNELKHLMKGKSSVFSGQSGTGKTALINALTGSDMLTGKIVAKTGKGAHTTTTTRLLPIGDDGYCIDTPGIKSFGMWNVTKEEVKLYFFEINEIAKGCKYQDCDHLHEPECAVLKALEEGIISRLRFDSYSALIANLKDKTTR